MRTNYGNSCKQFIWTKLKGQKSIQNILYHYCSDCGTSLFSVSQAQSTLVPLRFLILVHHFSFVFNPHQRTCLERGKERGRGRRENLLHLPSVCALTRTKLKLQTCALTWNRSGNLSAHRTMLNQLSHSDQAECHSFLVH